MRKKRNRFDSWIVAHPITVMLVAITVGMLMAYGIGFFDGMSYARH